VFADQKLLLFLTSATAIKQASKQAANVSERGQWKLAEIRGNYSSSS